VLTGAHCPAQGKLPNSFLQGDAAVLDTPGIEYGDLVVVQPDHYGLARTGGGRPAARFLDFFC